MTFPTQEHKKINVGFKPPDSECMLWSLSNDHRSSHLVCVHSVKIDAEFAKSLVSKVGGVDLFQAVDNSGFFCINCVIIFYIKFSGDFEQWLYMCQQCGLTTGFSTIGGAPEQV